MATINETVERLEAFGVDALLVKWEALVTGSLDGRSFAGNEYSDRTVQMIGTFDTSTVVLQGSNDGTNWETLTDPQGNAISMTSAGMEAVLEFPRFVRPLMSSAGGSSDVDVLLFMKKTKGGK